MKRYGNIRFTRRMVSFVCMLVVSLLILMPSQAVLADAQTYAKVISIDFTKDSGDNKYDGDYSASMTCSVQSDYPVYSFAFNNGLYGFITRAGSTSVDFYNKSKFKVTRGSEVVMQMDNALVHHLRIMTLLPIFTVMVQLTTKIVTLINMLVLIVIML